MKARARFRASTFQTLVASSAATLWSWLKLVEGIREHLLQQEVGKTKCFKTLTVYRRFFIPAPRVTKVHMDYTQLGEAKVSVVRVWCHFN